MGLRRCVVASLQRPDGTIADLLSNVGTGGGDVGDEKRRVEAELKRLDAEEVEIAALDVQRVYRREVLHGRMAKLNLRRDELQLQLKELNEQERLVEGASEIEGRIRAYCERLREGLDELAQVQGRIDLICRMDLIGREVTAAIRQVETVPRPAPPAGRPLDQIPQAAGLPLFGQRLRHGR